MDKETLEKVLKTKVEPILEETMHKLLGVTISEFGKDITDKIEKNPLIAYDINTSLPFKTAKKLFKKQFLTRMLQTHFGNVSAVAELTGLDRRSIHRSVKELKIGIKNIRRDMLRADYYRKEAVGGILKDTLNSYKAIIRPVKLQNMYQEVKHLSEDIVKELPTMEMTWDDAERLFEVEYFKKALKENKNNISKTARKIGIRYETLHRKLKKLQLKNL